MNKSTKSTWIYSLLLLMLGANAQARECPEFTFEQEYLLHLAYVEGYHYDLGYTLASIVWQESFVGEHIIRINNRDGDLGSYGVTHVQLSTAMYLLGYDNSWEARAELAPRLIKDDLYSIRLGLSYLRKHEGKGWTGMIARYNGRGQMAQRYAESVVEKVRVLEDCSFFS